MMAILLVIRLVVGVAEMVFALVVTAVEAVVAVVVGLVRAGYVAYDAALAYRAWSSGVLRCPAGHVVEFDDETLWTCEACLFRFRLRAPFRCPNVECACPTAYLDCAICGESVRNPWRWGRP